VFEADLETHELRKHGVRIRLAGQPFQALALLLHRPGEVVSREDLRNALWPGEPWGDHDQRLNKAINKLRDALNDSADTPRLIETIPRIGYRFLGSVLPLSDPVAETFSVTRAERSTGTALVDARPTPPVVVRSRSQIWRWGAGVLLLAP
jgi:DNA-binding winged helix-turn-helix (wHTH) protein